MAELRMRYLYELESAYHTHYEEGMMYPESYVILKNSIDRTMDSTENQLSDWTFIRDLIHKNFWIKHGYRLRICRCIDKKIESWIFDDIRIAYDVI